VGVAHLRRAFGQPPPSLESREAIDAPIHALLDAESAAERVCRFFAEFAALAPELAPPLPTVTHARDVHWLLTEPVWAEALRPVKAALQARNDADAMRVWFSLSKTILKCRWLHAHRADARVNLAAGRGAKAALDVVCAWVARLARALGDLGLGLAELEGVVLSLSPHELTASLCALGAAEPATGRGGVEPWTGGIAGQSLGRFESACVERMRVRVRDVARARVAAGEGAESDVPTLGYAHTAETMRALALLGELALALDGYARLLDSTAAGERVRAAYRAMQAASEMVLPAPDYAEATALPWLISLGGWQGALSTIPVGHNEAVSAEMAAELRAALEHAALVEAVRADEGVHAGRDALRDQAWAFVQALGEFAPNLPSEPDLGAGGGLVSTLAQSRAKDLVVWLLHGSEDANAWVEMPSRNLLKGDGEARVLLPRLAAWQQAVWDGICARQVASADDAEALACVGRLGLVLDQLRALSLQRAGARDGRKRTRAAGTN